MFPGFVFKQPEYFHYQSSRIEIQKVIAVEFGYILKALQREMIYFTHSLPKQNDVPNFRRQNSTRCPQRECPPIKADIYTIQQFPPNGPAIHHWAQHTTGSLAQPPLLGLLFLWQAVHVALYTFTV